MLSHHHHPHATHRTGLGPGPAQHVHWRETQAQDPFRYGLWRARQPSQDPRRRHPHLWYVPEIIDAPSAHLSLQKRSLWALRREQARRHLLKCSPVVATITTELCMCAALVVAFLWFIAMPQTCHTHQWQHAYDGAALFVGAAKKSLPAKAYDTMHHITPRVMGGLQRSWSMDGWETTNKTNTGNQTIKPTDGCVTATWRHEAAI